MERCSISCSRSSKTTSTIRRVTTLADFIISRHGLVGYNAIRQDAKVDLLVQLTSAVPQLAQIFQPPDKARMFFEELLCDPDNRPPEVEEPVEEEQPS